MGDFFDYEEDEMDGEVYNVAQRKTRDQLPGYTGHVHKLRQTFGTTYSNASRVALQCPPDSPEPMSQWDQARGTRVMTASGYNLPGSGFTALAIPNETTKGDRVYVQGSSVDLGGYYRTLEANNYDQVLIKSGSPKKAKSHLVMGDNFYYSGQHVWETTYQETFKEGPVMAALSNNGQAASAEFSGIPVMPGTEGGEEEEVNYEEATYRYRVIQAVVGKKRLDELEDQIRAKVTARMAGGAGELLKSFKLFSSGQGEIGPSQMMSVINDLGVDINRREAYALFGRFDINKDGGIVYYEFVDALLQKDEGITRDATYYDRR
mmetsp:Transcript_29479/g.74061  ORF Transcript_29479/g.74061 Transcript_29479/m.74061 type:complete len:320 (+) Transcript_29479:195-1154(+)